MWEDLNIYGIQSLFLSCLRFLGTFYNKVQLFNTLGSLPLTNNEQIFTEFRVMLIYELIIVHF